MSLDTSLENIKRHVRWGDALRPLLPEGERVTVYPAFLRAVAKRKTSDRPLEVMWAGTIVEKDGATPVLHEQKRENLLRSFQVFVEMEIKEGRMLARNSGGGRRRSWFKIVSAEFVKTSA
jgi:hypothetical protein